jgi:hypothetical protein
MIKSSSSTGSTSLNGTWLHRLTVLIFLINASPLTCQNFNAIFSRILSFKLVLNIVTAVLQGVKREVTLFAGME